MKCLPPQPPSDASPSQILVYRPAPVLVGLLCAAGRHRGQAAIAQLPQVSGYQLLGTGLGLGTDVGLDALVARANKSPVPSAA